MPFIKNMFSGGALLPVQPPFRLEDLLPCLLFEALPTYRFAKLSWIYGQSDSLFDSCLKFQGLTTDGIREAPVRDTLFSDRPFSQTGRFLSRNHTNKRKDPLGMNDLNNGSVPSLPGKKEKIS